MLAAILTLCGLSTALTSCSESDDGPQATPIGSELYKMWYAEATTNYTFDDGTTQQLKQVTALNFSDDGTGREYSFYIDGNNELKENAPMLLGADFTYTNVQGTISITRKDYLGDATKDLVRQLRHTDGTLLFGTTSLKPVTAEQQALLDAILSDGGNFSTNNVNDRNVPGIRFDYTNWHEKSTIYLYDGQNHEYDASVASRKFYQVYLPWSVDKTHGVQSHIPSDLMKAMTPENGWEMVLNYCGRTDMQNANMIFFYNKYTGTMRVLYYIPQTFSGNGASDHYWEIQVTDNMAYRSPWRYGIPMDNTIADKAAIGQTDAKSMSDRIVPWCSETQTNGAVPPNPGWWAFDFDMSSYNKNHVINDNDEIKFTMLTQKKAEVTLSSMMQGQINGTFDFSSDGGFSGGDWANGILMGLGAIGKVAAGGAAFKNQEYKDCLNAVGDAFGFGAGIAGAFSNDGNESYHGTISLGLTGSIDTTGKIEKESSYTGFASAVTIKMGEFDRTNSHLGQGVWNITSAPYIYMTNQAHKPLGPLWEREKDAAYSDWKDLLGGWGGCVWFFDPHSVQVELNPDIFPEGKIKWMQVDMLPGARYANKVTGTDGYRKFLGLNERNLKKTEKGDYNTGLGETESDGTKFYVSYGWASTSEVLTHYYYNETKPDGVKYGFYAPVERSGGYPKIVWGCGNDQKKYLIEPQISQPGRLWCVAPPVEINVQVAVKMDDGKVYVFNRIFLPQIGYTNCKQDELVALWKDHLNKQNNIKKYQWTRLKTYDYNRKRCYDKIKYMFPNADISYETWDQPDTN